MKDKRKLNAIIRDQVYLYMAEEGPVVSNSCNDCEQEVNPLSGCPDIPVSVCGNCAEGAANDLIIDCMLNFAFGCVG